MMPLRVMTFNLRNSGAGDGPNCWDARRQLWLRVVRQFDPDLLGTQEVLPDQYQDLQHAFADYGLVGVAREDGRERGERSLILYRRSRFDLLEQGDFWLSETPDLPGSQSWDAACCRICSWVRLRDKQSGQALLHANVHLDHVGEIARVESAKLLITRLNQLEKNAAIILTGDFNSTEIEAPYHLLTQSGFIDSYRDVHPVRKTDESSFHGFQANTHGLRIDWILHSADVKATHAEIDRTRGPDAQCASDHDAVLATLESRLKEISHR